MDRLADFKLGQSYPRAERNLLHMFKVIRSNGSKIEIWQIFLICTVKNTWKRRLIAKFF